MNAVLKAMDTNGDGRVDFQELMSFFIWGGNSNQEAGMKRIDAAADDAERGQLMQLMKLLLNPVSLVSVGTAVSPAAQVLGALLGPASPGAPQSIPKSTPTSGGSKEQSDAASGRSVALVSMVLAATEKDPGVCAAARPPAEPHHHYQNHHLHLRRNQQWHGIVNPATTNHQHRHGSLPI